VTPVYFAHGDRHEATWQQVRLAKAYLVTRLQLILQTGELRIAGESVWITQGQAGCSYSISPTIETVGPEADSSTADVEVSTSLHYS